MYPDILSFIKSRKDLGYVLLALTYINPTGEWSNASVSATVFLPTDAAFNKLAATYNTTVNDLIVWYADIVALVPNYHIVDVLNTPLKPLMQQAQVNNSVGPIAYPTRLGTLDHQQIRIVATADAVFVQSTSSVANVTEMDITCGAARVHVLDSVLQPWYSSLEEALNRSSGFSQFKAAVEQFNIRETIKASAAGSRHTLFAPVDSAWPAAQSQVSVNLTANSDTVFYHWVPNAISPTANQSFATAINKQLTYAAGLNGSIVSNLANVPSNVLTWIPIGLKADVSIYVIDKVLLPTYTSVWQVLETVPEFSFTYAAFRNVPSTVSRLQDGNSNVTLFAPVNAGVLGFVLKVAGMNGGNLTAAVSPQALGKIVPVHVALRAVTLADIRQGLTLDTLYGASSLRTRSTATNAEVQALETGAAIVATSRLIDISVNFGRAYVSGIDYVLSPIDPKNPSSDIASPSGSTNPTSGGGGGSASAAAPSLLLAAVMAAAVGRLLAWT